MIMTEVMSSMRILQSFRKRLRTDHFLLIKAIFLLLKNKYPVPHRRDTGNSFKFHVDNG